MEETFARRSASLRWYDRTGRAAKARALWVHHREMRRHMLFRELRLDWRYGITELLIVVAGVLIALGADQWVRGRADIALELRYLEDLAIDLRSDTAQLTAAIDLAESRATLGHSVLRAVDGDTVLSPEQLVVAAERQFYFAFPAYSRTTISDLMSTGNLRLIRDRDLKRQLSDYYQTVERLEQWTGNWRLVQQDVERIMPEILPLRLREAVIDPSAPSDGWGRTWEPPPWTPGFGVSASEADEILARLRAHPEARARIEGMVRVQGNQYGVLTEIRRRAVEALRTVESATSNR